MVGYLSATTAAPPPPDGQRRLSWLPCEMSFCRNAKENVDLLVWFQSWNLPLLHVLRVCFLVTKNSFNENLLNVLRHCLGPFIRLSFSRIFVLWPVFSLCLFVISFVVVVLYKWLISFKIFRSQVYFVRMTDRRPHSGFTPSQIFHKFICAAKLFLETMLTCPTEHCGHNKALTADPVAKR